MNFYQKENKYKNKIIYQIDGEKFDSKKEYTRWCELMLMQQGGLIENLQRQVPFILIPAQNEEMEIIGTNGKKTIKKKLLERKCSYIADFVYIDNKSGNQIVEDVKSKATTTPEYIIKRKLMLYIHKIIIKEI